MNTVKKRWLALVAALLVLGALAVPAIAQQGDTPSTGVSTPGAIEKPAAAVDDDGGEHEGLEEGVEHDYMPTEEDLADLQAEMDALAAAFDAAGIAYEVVEEDGIRWIEWDFEDDAANEVVEQVFVDLYGDEFEEFEDWVPSEEEIAEINAEMDALAAAFDAAGIAYEVVEEDGIRWIEWDYEDEAAEAVAAEFYKPSAEEIAEIQAEADEFRAFLDENGIAYELVTDEYGITWPEVADEDLEALDEFFCDEDFDDEGFEDDHFEDDFDDEDDLEDEDELEDDV